MQRNRQRFSYFLHPYVMLFLAPVIWSTSNITAKLAVGLLTPFQFAFYRWFLALLILTVFFSRRIRRDRATLLARKWWLLFWGGSAFALFNILLYTAFKFGAKSVNVGIINSLIPFLVIILSVLWGRERTHVLQWIGILSSFFGVIWLITGGQPLQLLQLDLLPADSIVLLASVIYAIYTFEIRRAPSVHWASLMWGMSIGAVIVATPFWLYELASGGQWHWLQAVYPTTEEGLKAFVIVLYVAIFVAILSKMFYMEGTIALGGNRSALAMNLLPFLNFFTSLLVFSDERATFTLVQAFAMCCVTIGILLSEIGAMRIRKQRH